MTIQMKQLPYEPTDLEPIISKKTLEFHYGKHYATYVKTTNDLIAGTPLENKSLDEIIQATQNNPEYKKLFNNAAQVFNHEFFWNSLTPIEENKKISPALSEKIIESFGLMETFYEEFNKAAVSQFGSGWVWLVSDGNTLKIVATSNAELPTTPLKPLLCLDVWEHAYYLDYQNKRADFANNIIRHLFNWKFAEENDKK